MLRHLRCRRCGFTASDVTFEEDHIDLPEPLYSCPRCGEYERLEDVTKRPGDDGEEQAPHHP